MKDECFNQDEKVGSPSILAQRRLSSLVASLMSRAGGESICAEDLLSCSGSAVFTLGWTKAEDFLR